MRNAVKLYFGRITAAGFLAVGAFLMVATYLPLLNSNLYGFEPDENGLVSHEILNPMLGEDHNPYVYYAVGTTCSLLLLVVSWIINVRMIKFGDLTRSEMIK